ncbi:uncharacterized protein KY384_008779 [Bacidia gigantensis]|uniref:uncharacterized protein n=1 Tax=Bacidia gigantensis TaxID=2732470 RepID=UPI001D04003C|nr:uncharacterized protein KY384_008779 [Bacidia gigantensis]KAG8526578.1 hypothetical protein KY384_008779 [Bacidia gigantensis]
MGPSGRKEGKKFTKGVEMTESTGMTAPLDTRSAGLPIPATECPFPLPSDSPPAASSSSSGKQEPAKVPAAGSSTFVDISTSESE